MPADPGGATRGPVRQALSAADLTDLVRTLCAEPGERDTSTWGTEVPSMQPGRRRLSPTRWPGVQALEWRPFRTGESGMAAVELAAPQPIPTLGPAFDPAGAAPREHGDAGPVLVAYAELPDLPARAAVDLQLSAGPAGERLLTGLTIRTESMARYR